MEIIHFLEEKIIQLTICFFIVNHEEFVTNDITISSFTRLKIILNHTNKANL